MGIKLVFDVFAYDKCTRYFFILLYRILPEMTFEPGKNSIDGWGSKLFLRSSSFIGLIGGVHKRIFRLPFFRLFKTYHNGFQSGFTFYIIENYFF